MFVFKIRYNSRVYGKVCRVVSYENLSVVVISLDLKTINVGVCTPV